jgi:hypothetical protein
MHTRVGTVEVMAGQLNMKRKFTTSVMRCMSIGWSSGGGVTYTLKDDQGLVLGSDWAGNTGAVRRAFGLARDDDWVLAAGKKVSAWFGVNGQVQRLTSVPQ